MTSDNVYKKLNDRINFSYESNNSFFLTYIIFLLFFTGTVYMYSYKSNMNKILQPTYCGAIFILMLFGFIIYMCKKLGLINKKQYLDTFLVLTCMFTLCFFLMCYVFLNSLNNICEEHKSEETKKQMNEAEMVSWVLFASVIAVLWLDDIKIWHQSNYLSYVIASIIALAGLFYYSTKYPSTSVLSLWLFIEWLILGFKRTIQAKNSLQFMLMKV